MLAKMTPEERVQWNQRNLAENEITKKQFQDIHIDEPKTPTKVLWTLTGNTTE